MISDEQMGKAIGQFQLHALNLFEFNKYGYKDQNDEAVKEMIILIHQLEERLKGKDVIIATERQLRDENYRAYD